MEWTSENMAANAALVRERIARACARVIRDGATIMMNSGTTTFYVAQELKRFSELNIVTNSLAIAQELGSLSSFRVILLGGNINVQYAFTHGGDVHDQLRRYRADYSILAAEGADMNGGVTTWRWTTQSWGGRAFPS